MMVSILPNGGCIRWFLSRVRIFEIVRARSIIKSWSLNSCFQGISL